MKHPRLACLAFAILLPVAAHAEPRTAAEASYSIRGGRDPQKTVPVSDCVLDIEKSADGYSFSLTSASQKLQFSGKLDTAQVPMPGSFYKEFSDGGPLSTINPNLNNAHTVGIGNGYVEFGTRKWHQNQQGNSDALDETKFTVSANPDLSQITEVKGMIDHNPLHGDEIYYTLECKFGN